MRTNYSKIASKIKPEVGEEENHHDNTQITSGAGDKSMVSATDGSSPKRKSPRKAGGK